MKVLTYKGENLHPASKAAELLREKKFDQLDEHMRQVNEVYYRLRGEKPPKKQKSVVEGHDRLVHLAE